MSTQAGSHTEITCELRMSPIAERRESRRPLNVRPVIWERSFLTAVLRHAKILCDARMFRRPGLSPRALATGERPPALGRVVESSA